MLLAIRDNTLPINLHYLAQLYAPNGVEWSHVSTVHRDYHRWWFDCQSAALIQEHVDPMASLVSFCSCSPFPCPPLWLAWLMKLMIKHLMSCDETLDPTIRPACSATRDESRPSIRGSASSEKSYQSERVVHVISMALCQYLLAYSVFARFFPQLKHLLVPRRIIRVSISDDFIVDFIWTVLLKAKFLLFTLKSRFEVFPVLVLDVFPAKVIPVIYKSNSRDAEGGFCSAYLSWESTTSLTSGSSSWTAAANWIASRTGEKEKLKTVKQASMHLIVYC